MDNELYGNISKITEIEEEESKINLQLEDLHKSNDTLILRWAQFRARPTKKGSNRFG
ncbi:MAG: hypothetical protein HQK70_09305 [Desulfamplus sp.]|nr:hypothetical protein [Desulfamplus sp.]